MKFTHYCMRIWKAGWPERELGECFSLFLWWRCWCLGCGCCSAVFSLLVSLDCERNPGWGDYGCCYPTRIMTDGSYAWLSWCFCEFLYKYDWALSRRTRGTKKKVLYYGRYFNIDPELIYMNSNEIQYLRCCLTVWLKLLRFVGLREGNALLFPRSIKRGGWHGKIYGLSNTNSPFEKRKD